MNVDVVDVVEEVVVVDGLMCGVFAIDTPANVGVVSVPPFCSGVGLLSILLLMLAVWFLTGVTYDKVVDGFFRAT